MMENQELIVLLKDTRFRLEIATKTLFNGRVIDSFFKLNGVRDKLNHVIDKVSNEIEIEQKESNESD